MTDHYHTLGLPYHAVKEEIQAAIEALTEDPGTDSNALIKAEEVLLDDILKQTYDQKLLAHLRSETAKKEAALSSKSKINLIVDVIKPAFNKEVV